MMWRHHQFRGFIMPIICRYCDKTKCTGKFVDHCTWCGEHCAHSGSKENQPRFCSNNCYVENENADKRLKKTILPRI